MENLKPRLRQVVGQPARGGQGHQRIAFAMNQQGRNRNRCDLLAQFGFPQPVEPLNQTVGVSGRTRGQCLLLCAGVGACPRIALVEQGDETLQGLGRVIANGGSEPVE